MLEAAALVRAIRQGDLDRLMIPEAPLDILAQQIVAGCAAGGKTAELRSTGSFDSAQDKQAGAAVPTQSDDGWDEDELFALVRACLSLSQSFARDLRRRA